MSKRPTPQTDANESITCKEGDPCIAPDFARQLERERDEARDLARELANALATVNFIDLSPCNGGSCMVATTADDLIDAIKNRCSTLLAKAKEVLG